MDILKIRALRGPNYWSNYRKKLILMRLDLGRYEELPTNLIPGFQESLVSYLPGLQKDRCSLGYEGGFLQRMQDGTWLGHVIEHVALELQCLAGMDCGFGRTYGTDDYGVYNVLFSYQVENAGLFAAKFAVDLVQALVQGDEYPQFQEQLEQLIQLYESERLGPSTQAIVNEAIRRNIPFKCHKNSSLVTLGYGRFQKRIWAAVSDNTNAISMDIASDKQLTKKILTSHFIPTPAGLQVETLDELEQAIHELGYPLVIKPLDGNHGRGVTTNVTDFNKALFGYELAKKISDKIIIERHITGYDYRFLVVNFKVIAVAKRTPAMVVGDGHSTIESLVNQINADPNRGESHEKTLTAIKIDEATLSMLQKKNLTTKSVLEAGKFLYLKETANLSSGGTATDVTDEVHPMNIFFAERAAKLLNLDICGIDVVSHNIQHPLTENHAAIIEVNAGPGLRMHLAPNKGIARNVAKPIVDMLYPQGQQSKMPIVAVTGTNGKTTVVRLIAHLARSAGHSTGATTTDGIYLNDRLLHAGDCSGPLSAAAVLYDPEVDYAVLECARGGILRSGLGFDECDISIITNISGDHLGLDGIATIDDLARVKAVVALSTKKTGLAILNADDELSCELLDELDCKVALFGLSYNPCIKQHCAQGGLAAYIKEGFVIINNGEEETVLSTLKEIPLSFQGSATCMTQNILSATLAAVASHFSLAAIKKGLLGFYPTSDNLPGRMNLFNFPHCQVLLDYAHNEGAFLELKSYLDTVDCEKKIGIIGVAGDRRAEDLQQLGYHAAEMFHEIIIRHDEDGRGRTNDEITELLLSGIKRSKFKPRINTISNEVQAIESILSKEHANTFVFCAVENVFGMINFLKKKQLLIDSEVYYGAES